MREPLPVEAVLPDVARALSTAGACVLVAPTGAGKTTRLPGFLEDAGMGPVIVLEPRRLAARAAARRVARERGVEVGREVGWHVRFDARTSRDTRITFATSGIFVRRLQDDPFLEGLGAVVLDEFHERSLEIDLALAMVARVRREVRPELKLIVTSATLDAEAVARYLGGAPIVRSEGRLFPVAIEHLPAQARERPEAHVARGVRRALAASAGDVLCFLPGVGEIARAHAELRALEREHDVVQLYGDLPPERQDAALERGPRRKVVLATNVAESSVTVAGVTAVVDTGLARTLRYDPAVGLDRLALGRVSRASADQRAGRAGREAPGSCVRLWSAIDDRALAAFDEPELRRADLAGALLQLLAWGERDLTSFPWLEPPPVEALKRALDLLAQLGALEASGLTALGATLARLPLAPRLARLVVEGHARGVIEDASLAAATLAERDPRRREPRGERGLLARASARLSDSDVADQVRALRAFDARGPSAAPELVPAAARACLESARQIRRIAEDALGRSAPRADDPDDALRYALCVSFADRLARRRPEDPTRGVLVGGRGVRLADECAVREGELFVAVDLDAGGGEALVRRASRVEREWVDGGRARVEVAAVFDRARERVVARRRVMLGALVLEESEGGDVDSEMVERALVEAARADVERALGVARPAVAGLIARLACLREWCPELEVPAIDSASIAELLPALAVGRRSFAELRDAPLEDAILGLLTQPQRAALEREAPERIEVPSGSRIRLAYEAGRPPVLAARIQELFGLRETPRVGRGRVAVLVHLLAPNGRPQQVTDDLASFWRGAYFDVRKELRRRYPRHAWPEDPLAAQARRRPGGA